MSVNVTAYIRKQYCNIVEVPHGLQCSDGISTCNVFSVKLSLKWSRVVNPNNEVLGR